MKRIILLLISTLIISISFSDTIRYKEKKLFGDYMDKEVTDVRYMGINRLEVHYEYPGILPGNVQKSIKCEDVYEIIDDNGNNIDFLCEEYTYNENRFNNQTNMDNSKIGGVVISIGSILIYSTIDSECNWCDSVDEFERFDNKLISRQKIGYILIAIGGLLITLEI